MTKETYKKLKAYEAHLSTAYYKHYIRCLAASDVEALEAIYQSLGYKLGNRHCSECVLQMCINLGKLYFNYENGNNKGKSGCKKASGI